MSQEFQDILPCYFLGWVHSYRQRLWTTTPPSLLYGGVGDRPAHFFGRHGGGGWQLGTACVQLGGA